MKLRERLHRWRTANLVKDVSAFFGYLWQRFSEDNCLQAAGLLSYNTLLALVPLTAVALSIVSAFPVFDQWSASIQDFIFENFVPAAGRIVQEHVNEFAAKASKLTAPGTVFLVFTALWLMGNIERAINRIWRVRNPRRWISKFMVYWAVLTLSPLLIGASLAITSYVVSLPVLSDTAAAAGLRQLLFLITPFLASGAAFTLLYLVVPNRPVRFLHALAGGMLAAVLFELAKRGFAAYLIHFPVYEAIYGALAVIPIFLFWIYVSWAIILLGVVFSAALHHFRRPAMGRPWTPRNRFQLAFRLVGHLYSAQQAGKGLNMRDLLRLERRAEEDNMLTLLDALVAGRLVRRSDRGEWLLARDPGRIRLLDVYRICRTYLPSAPEELVKGDAWDDRLREALEHVGSNLEKALGRPLSEYYEKQEG